MGNINLVSIFHISDEKKFQSASNSNAFILEEQERLLNNQEIKTRAQNQDYDNHHTENLIQILSPGLPIEVEPNMADEKSGNSLNRNLPGFII